MPLHPSAGSGQVLGYYSPEITPALGLVSEVMVGDDPPPGRPLGSIYELGPDRFKFLSAIIQYNNTQAGHTPAQSAFLMYVSRSTLFTYQSLNTVEATDYGRFVFPLFYILPLNVKVPDRLYRWLLLGHRSRFWAARQLPHCRPV